MSIRTTMQIKHLCFVGPEKETAAIEFGPGLNLVYGPSNTGKSSILDAIDFMMGREKKLKEIPEHVGYSEIVLAIDFSDGAQFTLVRPLQGGDFKLFEGIYTSVPSDLDYTVLRSGKSTKKEQNLSEFLLEKIGLDGKKLKKNAKNETENLTIRTLLPLFLINETDIQKEISPFLSVQYTKKTTEISRLRLLLTGVDDSALVPEKVLEKERISRSARAGVLDELIQDISLKISDYSDDETTIDQLRDQSEKLERSIEDANNSLMLHQSNYSDVLTAKSNDQKLYREATERQSELLAMQSRFSLLLDHYKSDIARLDGIIESGSLISALSSDICPLCGASAEDQNADHACDGDIDGVVEAANAEKEKIFILQRDLERTLSQIRDEQLSVDETIGRQRAQLAESTALLKSLEPDLSQFRTKYSDLVAAKSSVSKRIGLFESLEDLQNRLEKSREDREVDDQNKPENKVPEKSLYDLAAEIRSLLSDWQLPNSQNVHFADETTDIVINGKHRISNGKGHRSITHASVTLGLAKFLGQKDLPRLGWVVLDSPLIAYEEPDDDDDISRTDLNEKFFECLANWDGNQTIVFENRKSITENIKKYDNVTQFTKVGKIGRYGFFPR